MPLERWRRSEVPISVVKIIQNAQDAVALGELAVMEVVKLRRRETGQVVAAVVGDCPQDDHCKPEPAGDHVRTRYNHTQSRWY